jgi:hypothetical protein
VGPLRASGLDPGRAKVRRLAEAGNPSAAWMSAAQCPLHRRCGCGACMYWPIYRQVEELQGRHIPWRMAEKRQGAAKGTTGSEERLNLSASCPLMRKVDRLCGSGETAPNNVTSGMGDRALTKFPKASVTVELRSNREDAVFDALIEVLEETPEALSGEYSVDFLCDLVRSYVPDVTTAEIVKALDILSARATALREFMRNDGSDLHPDLPAKRPACEGR